MVVIEFSMYDYDLDFDSIIIWDGETDIKEEVEHVLNEANRYMLLDFSLEHFHKIKDKITDHFKRAVKNNLSLSINMEYGNDKENKRIFINFVEFVVNKELSRNHFNKTLEHL